MNTKIFWLQVFLFNTIVCLHSFICSTTCLDDNIFITGKCYCTHNNKIASIDFFSNSSYNNIVFKFVKIKINFGWKWIKKKKKKKFFLNLVLFICL